MSTRPSRVTAAGSSQCAITFTQNDLMERGKRPQPPLSLAIRTLKPTWKGNLLLLLVAMLISASITFCLRNNMVAGRPDDARQMASAKLPASSQR
jgi:hypothetical protein